MLKISLRQGLKIALLNFLIVSILGAVMRYKIVFSLPFLDQKHLQEAHSHFAFYGWVTTAVYFFMVYIIRSYLTPLQIKQYHALIILNLIGSYGMLGTFIYGGYYWGSIVCSAVSLLAGIAILILFSRDYTKINTPSKLWFLGGLAFAGLSALGGGGLVYMKATGGIVQNWYLAATYFYLHFQYNGFFVLSCMGLFFNWLHQCGIGIENRISKRIFWLIFSATVLNYGLSLTWMNASGWIVVLSAMGIVLQMAGFIGLVVIVRRYWEDYSKSWSKLVKSIFLIIILAFSLKVILQQLSIIPQISHWVFGFRTIVIAYLHLVLLVVVSSFLLLNILLLELFETGRAFRIGLISYLVLILINEAVLAQIGILSLFGIYWSASPLVLWWVSIGIVAAIALLVYGLKTKKRAG
ncbi:hypothetical protein [Riemerella columbipharyngis]|uniref:NnrS protein n=1 Tax=Riemerella columbipharyngis TaxID=1071918 RepID=A0A1G7C665_9FLAO|nr:hypothetical protein [Riemerella columbipharyngis]SDE34811.1 hypothetical protein SAMN05421544_10766 [Riemerella columbipharyngis]